VGISKEESDDKASRGEKYTIRLKVPDTYPRFEDLIHGRIGGPKAIGKKLTHGQQSFEDPILLKSDGHPTYHLANVVDDHHMKITHVIRAVEWMPSTPKHLHLYEAFGWEPPAFAHVGLLQGPNNQKLSKRNADTDIKSYKNQGIFPEALTNFVALLGWSHRQSTDILSLEQLVENVRSQSVFFSNTCLLMFSVRLKVYKR
jgi:glutamyl-tRNA synthetase